MTEKEAKFLAPHLVALAASDDPKRYCQAHGTVWTSQEMQWASDLAHTIESERESSRKAAFKAWCDGRGLDQLNVFTGVIYKLETKVLPEMEKEHEELWLFVAKLEKQLIEQAHQIALLAGCNEETVEPRDRVML